MTTSLQVILSNPIGVLVLVVAPLLLAAAAPAGAGPRTAIWASRVSLVAAVGLAAAGALGPLRATCLVFATFVVFVAASFSRRHLDGDIREPGYRRALLLTAAAAAVVLAGTDLVLVTVGWLVSGWGTARLVGHHSDLAVTDQAVRVLRRASRVGDLAMVTAAGCWATAAGTTSIADACAWVAAHPRSPASLAGAGALLIAVAARCGLMPFHRWLPLSVVAPAPVSALLHAGVVNGPVLVLVATEPGWGELAWFGPALVVLGLGTSVLTFPRLLVRPDVKVRLAWSTVAQLGFMVTLVGIGATGAAVLHLVLHGLYKANAFLRAGQHLSRARRDPLTPSPPRARWVGVSVGLTLGLVLLAVDHGWRQPLSSVAVLVAAAAAGRGLMAVQARWTTRVAAAALGAAGLAAMLTLAATVTAWWSLPLESAGPRAWAAACVVALSALFGTWALHRRPARLWALLHRSADPSLGALQAAILRIRRSLPAGTSRALPIGDSAAAAGLATGVDPGAVRDAVRRAAQVLTPAWSWTSFVAANPLWGGRHLDLQTAATLDRSRRAQAADAAAAEPRMDDIVAGWLAAWTCTAPIPWPAPGRDLPLWQWFRTVAMADPVLDGSRRCQPLPSLAVDVLAARWGTQADLQGHAEIELLRLPGWSAYLARRSTSAAAVDVDALIDLLAVREYLRVSLAGTSFARGAAWGRHTPVGWLSVPKPLQEADILGHESAPRHHLLTALSRSASQLSIAEAAPTSVEAELVFCIDVRSERLRRHLESLGPYRTTGFAGFFGLPLHRQVLGASGSDRLPALLRPAITVTEPAPAARVQDLLVAGLQGALDSPGGGFAAVEVAGAVGLAGLAGMTRIGLGLLHRDPPAPLTLPRPVDSDRPAAIQAAVGLVRATGLAGTAASVVVLVGHGSTSTNNPAESAFDCGACGGHRGGFNARVAADLLNAADTRAALAAEGLSLPAGTVVLAAEHDTATDAVQLLEPHRAGPQHQAPLSRLQQALQAAGAATALERCETLPLTSARSLRSASREVRRRSLDPSEVRHEWGLAANAFFIAAPRRLTRSINLDGRAFLHDYDPDADPSGAMLETILTAPMVVAHWINTQYLLSTHDPAVYGSGTKTAHNPVGGIGVLSGPGGDLRTGLTEQSVMRAAQPVQPPVRLLAVIAADPARIDAVLERHPDLAALVSGRWLHLSAIHPDTGQVAVRDDAGWRPFNALDSDPHGRGLAVADRSVAR